VIQEQINVYDRALRIQAGHTTDLLESDFTSAVPSVATISSASRYDQATRDLIVNRGQSWSTDFFQQELWLRKRLGSLQPPISFAALEIAMKDDPAFANFRSRLGIFLTETLPTCGYSLPTNADGRRFRLFDPDEQVHSHYSSSVVYVANAFCQIRAFRLLQVAYESVADWSIQTDYLRVHPRFHGRPRYDAVLVEDTLGLVAFAKMKYIFACTPLTTGRPFNVALVQYLDPIIAAERSQSDRELGYLRLKPKAGPNSEAFHFIFIESIIRGALLIPTSLTEGNTNEYFVFDILDDDMFLRMRRDFPGTVDGPPIAESDLVTEERSGPDLAKVVSEFGKKHPARGTAEEVSNNEGFVSLFADDSDEEAAIGDPGQTYEQTILSLCAGNSDEEEFEMDSDDDDEIVEDSDGGEYFNFDGLSNSPG